MSKLRRDIETAYLTYLKSGHNEIRKDALMSVKVGMINWEKANPGKELTDEIVITILQSEIKKRDQAIIGVEKMGNMSEDQLKRTMIHNTKEALQQKALQEWLPEQMSDEEMQATIVTLALSLKEPVQQRPIMPQIMQHFNQNFKGKFDNKKLKQFIENYLKTLT